MRRLTALSLALVAGLAGAVALTDAGDRYHQPVSASPGVHSGGTQNAGAQSAGAPAAVTAGAPATPVANASFERRTGTTPTCWTLLGLGKLTVVGAGHTGSAAARVIGRGPATATVELLSSRDSTCRAVATAGRLYGVGFWYQATRSVRLVVDAQRATGAWTRWVTSAPYSPSSLWALAETVTPPVPAGTVALSIGLAGAANGNLTADDATLTDAGEPAATAGAPLFAPAFAQATALVTNEYADRHPTKADSALSDDWDVTSGSLFSRAGTGWTGAVDGRNPDAKSVTGTDAAVFRLRSNAQSFQDVTVGLQADVLRLSATKRTPAGKYDGVHIWLRYQSPYRLYVASVARRDGRVAIKKKCPGGSSNGGTYYPLSKETAGYPIVLGAWRTVAASAMNNPDGTVTVTLSIGGTPVLSGVDTGVGCAPIRAAGSVGLRGDNAEIQFRSFTATGL